jgi:hypothetical protein
VAKEVEIDTLFETEISVVINDIRAARNGRDFEARLQFARSMLNGIGYLWLRFQTMGGPLRSAADLAPT